MTVEVFARPGDSRALSVLAAARLSGVLPNLRQRKELPASAPPSSSLLGSTAVLTLLDGQWVAEPSAAAAALLGFSSSDKWLEWDASTLRPAVLGASQPDGTAALTAALQHLSGSLSTSSPWLAGSGSAPGAADLAAYATLLPLLSGAVPSAAHVLQGLPAIAQWEARFTAVQAVAEAKQQLLGEPAAQDALLSCYAADSALLAASTPRLPKKGERNILVTSALPYVNNVPHLGNIIGCVLSADCYARYCRQRGYNTVYVCGTDEYGTATETKALEEGLSCAELCDKYHAIHAQVYQWFDIQFDKFGRTPTRWQTRICQDMFERLDSQACVQEQTMEQLFSVPLGKFLADRFVTGTCPKCKYEDARGDQCDSCGNLLNPTELINPKCKLTGTTPIIKSTSHLFLDLPKLSPQLQQYQDATSALGGWSSNCVQVTAAWMRDGLKSRCITRDLKWGTPVPRQGYQDKVFYVWFDAPIGYISITANYTPEWEQWWKNPQNVELVQFMGKDNVPFHTVIFPASLIGTGEAWTMMRSISVTEYLNYEGGKFSKSRGTGVFGTDAKDTGIPVEVWRYYLLSVRPEAQDTDFKWSDLQARNNSELLANLGNFINRGLQFVVKFCEGKVPPAHATKGADQAAELSKAVKDKVSEYVSAMEKAKLKEGIRLAMLISADGNKFLQDTKPWVVVKEDPEHCGTIVRAALGVVRLLAALVAPFMPGFSRKVLEQLALPESALDLSDQVVAACANVLDLAPPAGHAVGTPAPLISIISDETIAALRERYGGNQQERDAKAAAAAPGGAAKAPAGGKAAGAGGAAKAAGEGKAKTAGTARQDGLRAITGGIGGNYGPGMTNEVLAPMTHEQQSEALSTQMGKMAAVRWGTDCNRWPMSLRYKLLELRAPHIPPPLGDYDGDKKGWAERMSRARAFLDEGFSPEDVYVKGAGSGGILLPKLRNALETWDRDGTTDKWLASRH